MDDWGLDDIFNESENSDSSSSGDSLSWDEPESKKVKNNKLTAGRVVWCVFVGIFFSGLLSLLTMALYTRYIKYPDQEVIAESTTGRYGLGMWLPKLQSLDSTGEESYIQKEILFANGDEAKVDFYKKMCSTVSYKPKTVVALNIFGNPMIDRETDEVVYIDSYVWENEEVDFSFIDYTAINTDEYADKIAEIMAQRGVEYGCVDYENKLVGVFVEFMNWLPVESIPIKTISRVPEMVRQQETLEDGSINSYFTVVDGEDVYIDRLLFSSNEFRDLMDRFSLTASGQGVLQETQAYIDWSESENRGNTIRPSQYNYKECMNKTWCGTYYLTNEYVPEDGEEVVPIVPELGDGSFENPASIGTDCVTNMYITEYDSLGHIESYQSYPIRVRLTEYGLSQDAINYFENKDDRNRGINLKSNLQYIYMVFEVTNLSGETLTIPSNMGLCDRNGNVQARTGVIYGMNESVTLAPDKTGYIETWQSSTELYKKYLIWGADFARREEPMWFRVLAGNLEDESTYKGVWVEGGEPSDEDEVSTESPEVTAPPVNH